MNNKQIDKNLPNKLTILRILLVPVFIIVLWLPMITGNSQIEFVSKITAALILRPINLFQVTLNKIINSRAP